MRAAILRAFREDVWVTASCAVIIWGVVLFEWVTLR